MSNRHRTPEVGTCLHSKAVDKPDVTRISFFYWNVSIVVVLRCHLYCQFLAYGCGGGLRARKQAALYPSCSEMYGCFGDMQATCPCACLSSSEECNLTDDACLGRSQGSGGHWMTVEGNENS